MQKKEKIYWDVIHTVLRFEVMHGHLKWKVSELARACGVSRPLIYHYLGKTKEEIVDSALDIVAQEFYGFSESRQKFRQEKGFNESVKLSRKLAASMPYLMCYHYTWRQRDQTKPGQKLQAMEKKYGEALRRMFPKVKDEDFPLLWASVHGIVSATFLTDKQVDQALATLGRVL